MNISFKFKRKEENNFFLFKAHNLEIKNTQVLPQFNENSSKQSHNY